jgi:hypothetical protein
VENAIVEYATKEQAHAVRQRKTQVIEESLAQIVKRAGALTAAAVIAAATDEEHPLHEYFEWDDTEAASKWRLAQATAMIIGTRYVCYLKEKQRGRKPIEATAAAKGITVRRFLPAFQTPGFRERAEVMADKDARRSMVEKKLSALRGWCNSVVDIAELAEIRTQVLTLIA